MYVPVILSPVRVSLLWSIIFLSVAELSACCSTSCSHSSNHCMNSSSSHWKRQGSGTLNVYLTMQKHVTTYFEPEVSTAAVGSFECFRRLEATGVICDIHSIKEVVKLLNEFCCLSSIFSKEELDPLCHCVAQNLKQKCRSYTTVWFKDIPFLKPTCAAKSTLIFEKEVKYICSYLSLYCVVRPCDLVAMM